MFRPSWLSNHWLVVCKSSEEAGDDGRVIWHPDFKGNVGDPVNAKFIEAVVQRVLENEKVIQLTS